MVPLHAKKSSQRGGKRGQCGCDANSASGPEPRMLRHVALDGVKRVHFGPVLVDTVQSLFQFLKGSEVRGLLTMNVTRQNFNFRLKFLVSPREGLWLRHLVETIYSTHDEQNEGATHNNTISNLFFIHQLQPLLGESMSCRVCNCVYGLCIHAANQQCA